MNPAWHIITGEYPDQPGGVSDYTRLIARSLARCGEEVHVWAPSFAGNTAQESGVNVHRLPGNFDLHSLRFLGGKLNAWPRPSRLLIQYVPHAFGRKAMNVPFVRWLLRRRQPVWVMFHEAYFPWERGQSIKHQFLGFVNSRMAAWSMRAAERIFISIPSWRERLQRVGKLKTDPVWLPVPSNLPTDVDPTLSCARRRDLGIPHDYPLVGHFGTYGDGVARLLGPVLEGLHARLPNCHFLLIGRGSDRFLKSLSNVGPRFHAADEQAPLATSATLAMCDLLVQPFPDGVSCRRGSAMAALALGKPIVTTVGFLSEPFWSRTPAVRVCPVDEPEQLIAQCERLLADESERNQLGAEAKRLYSEHFSVERTVDVLLERRAALSDPTSLT